MKTKQPGKVGKIISALFVMLLLSSLLPASSDEDLRLPRVVVASGGPYQSQTASIQRFYDRIAIGPEYLGQPLSLVCTNGSITEQGFAWLRMILLPDSSDQNLQSYGEPLGRLLVNENSFLSSAQIYIDLSAQLRAGENKICIEAAGRPGAVFNWEIRSIGKPQLSMPEQLSTTGGAWLTIYGNGFSLRPEENTVQLGPGYLPVAQSASNFLKVFIPRGFPAGSYDLSVSIRTYRSRIIKVQVLAPKKDS
ncbi:MAG: IPT/TIG domain-containing protein [Candidatus Obscuribacterales bacterium]|nr:IPT/TIG domain-containing protein [Candidatus Obscuribacterales bacterium]